MCGITRKQAKHLKKLYVKAVETYGDYMLDTASSKSEEEKIKEKSFRADDKFQDYLEKLTNK